MSLAAAGTENGRMEAGVRRGQVSSPGDFDRERPLVVGECGLDFDLAAARITCGQHGSVDYCGGRADRMNARGKRERGSMGEQLSLSQVRTSIQDCDSGKSN